MRRNDNVAARKHLTAALKLADDYRVRQLLATTHQRVGELWPAAHHLQQAIALAPPKAQAALHDRLGLVYVKLNKRGRACAAFRAALQLRSDAAAAQAHAQRYCGK